MKKDNNKETLRFVFPNIMAKMMKKVDMRTQLESSMMSMFMIMCGMFLTTVYLLFFGEMGWVYKCLILFNLFCAFIFISSFLVTTYQQYIEYMKIMGIDPDKHREEILKRGNIFKRIKLAIQGREKKKKSKNKRISMIDEAIENMIKIKGQELKDTQKLQKEADRLRKEKEEEDKKKNGNTTERR